MADSAPNTGYEPKLANFFSHMDPERSPINITDSHHNFLCPDDATMIPTNPEGLPNSEASIWKQSACVSGRFGLQETGAELDRESVATTILSSQSKGKRSRSKRCAFVETQNHVLMTYNFQGISK